MALTGLGWHVISVDEFLATHAVPVLRSEGFRRRRQEFILVGPQGLLGVVGFYPNALPDSMGFFVQYGVVTPSYVAFGQDNGAQAPRWPSPSDALLMVQVFTPDESQLTGAPGTAPYRWVLGDTAANEVVGAELQDRLTREVIPNIREW